jgi:hypothetical protein
MSHDFKFTDNIHTIGYLKAMTQAAAEVSLNHLRNMMYVRTAPHTALFLNHSGTVKPLQISIIRRTPSPRLYHLADHYGATRGNI